MPDTPSPKTPAKPPSIFVILKPYLNWVIILATVTVAANALSLWIPKIISHAIDDYAHGTLQLPDLAWKLGLFGVGIFILTYGQSILQTVVSERVAKDMRNKLADKISRQSHSYIDQTNPSVLLTNLTSDIDALKNFVAQAVSSLISSVFLIIGASILLLLTDWKLGLAVLTIVPFIGIFFMYSLKKVRALFLQGRQVIDRLNQVIQGSILGAALVRVLNSQQTERDGFSIVNSQSRDIGLSIIKIFSALIPVIGFIANMATLIILGFGGHLVLSGQMSLGDYAAFNSYIGILIFPIIILGFISNMIAQASASYGRILTVMHAPDPRPDGTIATELTGSIAVSGLTVSYGQKQALKDVSFMVAPGSRVAILGPTAAGKTQLLYALTGLIHPATGTVLYDGQPLTVYEPTALHRQIGFVFQDSVVFNLSLRENIAFSTDVKNADLAKAIETAELSDFIESLPQGLDTVISERGSSLSGGQKQRLMLARALALNPHILLLDDFTARVDGATEAKILANLHKNYPSLTLISVTQKIGSVQDYDQILLLMEGELLAHGVHQDLLKSSPEYMQIYTTQQSTDTYELHPA